MDAPTWADQWGAGGIGAMEEEKKTEGTNDAKKPEGKKMYKAKAAAMAGAHKVKNSTSIGIKWIKTQCQKKSSPSK